MSAPPIIIIAEPDPMFSGVLRVEFTHMDFAVLLAADGREAEDYASLTVAHLVVLDAGGLNLGAYEACARIRRLAGYASRPIVLTANDLSDKVRAAAQKSRRHHAAGEALFGQRSVPGGDAASAR